MSSTEVLTLSHLPSDVIRSITRKVGMLLIDNARLISPRWNASFLESLNAPNRPVIQWIRWEVGMLKTVIFKTADVELIRYSINDETNDINRIARLFSRCSRIDRIEFSAIDFQELAIIRNAMAHIAVEELTITGLEFLEQDFQSSILNCLRNSGTVGRLIFSPESNHAELHSPTKLLVFTCGSFLYEAVRLVTEIEIVVKEQRANTAWSWAAAEVNSNAPGSTMWPMRLTTSPLLGLTAVTPMPGPLNAQLITEQHFDSRITYRVVMKAL